jgi:uncharacterized protein
MAENANVELVRGIYDAFAKGDVGVMNEGFADDVAFHFPGRHPLAGDRHTKEATLALLGQLAELSNGTLTVEVQEIFGQGETVVALVRFEGERNGKSVGGQRGAQISHVRNGKVVEFWGLSYDPYIVDEFWS